MAITLTNVTSGYNTSTINANFQNLETYINNILLSRADTGVAGEGMMGRDLDMNGFRILNADIAASELTNDRALRVPFSEGYIAPLPVASARANKLLAFDSTGLPVTIVPSSGSAADVLLQLNANTGATLVGTNSGAKVDAYTRAYDISTVDALRASSLPAQITVVKTSGYSNIFGRTEFWKRAGTTGAASQTPLQLNALSVTDATGAVWNMEVFDHKIYIDSLGAVANGTTDAWDYLELAFKNAGQGTGRVVTGLGPVYLFNKPILMKSGRHLEFDAKFGINLIYGGQFLTETDAPAASTPAGVGYTSTFSDKKAMVVVAHSNSQFANYWSMKNFYMYTAGNVAVDYGIYCPFANNFEIDSSWFVGGMIGLDARNLYAYTISGSYFNPPNGVMGTVGFNVTPIQNGLGSGTSGTLTRVGISNYRFSWIMIEMNYTTMTSCYSEGSLTRNALTFTRSHGINVNTYGIENLTQVGGEGRLFAATDSQVSVIGLQASFNVNLSGCTAVSVAGASFVNFYDMFITAVGTAYSPFVTDSTSRVQVFGFKYTGPTPAANAIGVKTTLQGIQGQTEVIKFSGDWAGGFMLIGSARIWDNAGQLRVKYGSDPTSATDGAPL
jgi:hypothetical protein